MARKKNNPQHNIEDKTFTSLIKKFTRRRDWEMVRALFFDYGKVLEVRAEETQHG